MKKIFLSIAAVATVGTTMAQNKSKIALKSENDTVVYVLANNMSKYFIQMGIENPNLEILKQAFQEAYAKVTPSIDAAVGEGYVRKFSDKQKQMKGRKNLEAGKKFLEENKKRKGVVELPDGLQYEVITMGTGAKPTVTDKVKTHYHGTLIDGTVFDSSVQRGQPISFPLNGVIKGWTEALQLMPVGSKWKLFLPAHLAYGENGSGGVIGPNSTLVFEVELIDIEK
jgi:FKBP-type peptidyl-prolyl cis-trans isomerase FklB